MTVDPSMLLSLAGGLRGGGGGTKVSQTSNNTSNTVLSFNSVNNLGGGAIDGVSNPTTAPVTTNASSSAGGADETGSSFMPYDYGVGAGGDVAAMTAAPPPAEGMGNMMPWLVLAGGAAALWFLG